MGLKQAIKKEPVAAISLVVSLVVATFGSPIFLEWYFGPKVIMEADYRNTQDARCAPFRLVVRNDGTRPAENVVIQYDVDFFTSRGDIEGLYSGHEPFAGVKQQVDYAIRAGEIRIPRLQPGQAQEFRYVETINDVDAHTIRLRRIAEGDRRLIYFPRMVLAIHDRGTVRLHKVNARCEKGS